MGEVMAVDINLKQSRQNPSTPVSNASVSTINFGVHLIASNYRGDLLSHFPLTSSENILPLFCCSEIMPLDVHYGLLNVADSVLFCNHSLRVGGCRRKERIYVDHNKESQPI